MLLSKKNYLSLFTFSALAVGSQLAVAQDDVDRQLEKARRVPRVGEDTSEAGFESRLQKARAVPQITRNDKGGAFIGGGVSFGQAYSAQPKSTPGFAFLGTISPGFIMQNTSFYRAELSLDIPMGTLAYKDSFKGFESSNTVTIPFGFMPKFGYGYSLTDGMFGVLNVHAGAVNGSLDGKVDGGGSFKNDGVWGFGFGAGYDLVFQASNSLELIGGFQVTHFQFGFNSVKDNNGIKADETYNLNLNVPRLALGARFRF